MKDAERYADKIAKLLRKAESTTPEEAESLTEKAQELMTQYSISEELIERAKGEGRKERENIVREKFACEGSYRHGLAQILIAVSRANDCSPVYTHGTKSKAEYIYVNGFESDVERVRMLFTSLQIQAIGAMQSWWKSAREEYSYLSSSRKWAARREFMVSFGHGLDTQLAQAQREGRKAAAREAEKHGDTDADNSVAMVVRDKKAHVKDWIDQTYGRLTSRAARQYSSPGGSASISGFDAGRSADASARRGVGGSNKQLGS